MRKTQEKLLEKARKHNFTKEQIAFLSKEDIPIKTLNDYSKVFAVANGFSVNAARKYLEAGHEPWHLWWKPKMTYEQYNKLPDVMRNDMRIVSNIWNIIHWNTRLNPSLPEAVGYFMELSKDITDDRKDDFAELLSREAYNIEGRKRGMDTADVSFYGNFFHEWFLTITKDEIKKAREDLRKSIESSLDYRNEALLKETDLRRKKRIAGYIKQDKERLKKYKKTDLSAVQVWDGFYKGYPSLSAVRAKEPDPKKAVMLFRDKDFWAAQEAENEQFRSLFKDIDGLEHENIFYHSDDEKAHVQYLLSNTKLTGTLEIKAAKVEANLPFVDDGDYLSKPLFINFRFTDRCSLFNKYNHGGAINERSFEGSYHGSAQKLIVYPDGTTFFKKRGRYQPALIRDVLSLFKRSGYPELLDKIMQLPAVKESYIFKDMVSEYDHISELGLTFPSITWNECLGAYTRNQLMEKRFKETHGINFNKLGICRGYAYLKTLPYVDDKSRNILYNAVTNNVIRGYAGRATGNNVAQSVMRDYLSEKIIKELIKPEDNITDMLQGGMQGTYAYEDANENDIRREVSDYISTCLRNKTKVNLKTKSLRKIVTRNVDMTLAMQNENTPVIRIPKDSKFRLLEKSLPSDFEYIKTRERIIAEGKLMRHCVASYAENVKQDQCAIYHLFKDGKNYTIEFRMDENDKGYTINQIQSRANRSAPKEIWNYVQGLIKDIPAPKNDKKKREKSA